jgi:drug/metabolite transporter (DMT)-like permease
MQRIIQNGYLLMVITAVAWSGNAIVARGVHEVVPPVGLAFWRWMATLPVFLLFAWPHFRKDLPAALRHWKIMLLFSVLSVSIYNSVIYIALNSTTATNSFLINTSRPMIIVLMSLLFFGVRVGAVQAAGLVLGLVGTSVVVFRGDLSAIAELDLVPGDMWVVVATTFWALYTVFLHKRPKIHPTSFMLFTAVAGVAMLLPFYVAETILYRPVPVVPETFLAVAYLSLVASVIAYMSYNRAVELLGANKAGLTSYLLPVFGVALAIILLGEAFRPYHAAGVAMLLSGVYLATKEHKSIKEPK